jgi:hypothetical protein
MGGAGTKRDDDPRLGRVRGPGREILRRSPLSRRIVQPCGLAEHIELCSPSAVAQTSQHTLLIGLGEPRKTKLTSGLPGM